MWDWLDGIVDWGSDVLGGVDAYDLSDTSDYWSSDVGFDSGFSLDGMSNFWGENKDWLSPIVKSGYGAYKTGRDNEAYIARYKPLQDYYNKMLPQMQNWYDPANVQAGVGAEFDRRAGMLSDVWRGQDQPAYARALATGTYNSAAHGRDKATIDASRNRQLLTEVLPAAEQAYYAKPEQMLSQMRGTSSMFSNQPSMQSAYVEAQQNPWGTALDRYINSL